MFYKELGLFTGQFISSSNLMDMAKYYAKKNYISSNFSMTTFGTNTKVLFTDYVKRSNCIKYDFKNLSTTKFKEHMYKMNKEYYLYINNLENDYISTFEKNAVKNKKLIEDKLKSIVKKKKKPICIYNKNIGE